MLVGDVFERLRVGFAQVTSFYDPALAHSRMMAYLSAEARAFPAPARIGHTARAAGPRHGLCRAGGHLRSRRQVSSLPLPPLSLPQ